MADIIINYTIHPSNDWKLFPNAFNTQNFFFIKFGQDMRIYNKTGKFFGDNCFIGLMDNADEKNVYLGGNNAIVQFKKQVINR